MDDSRIKQVVMLTRIIVVGMCLGCLIFIIIAAFLRPLTAEPLLAAKEDGGLAIITIIVFIMAPSIVVARFVVIRAQDVAARQNVAEDELKLLSVFTTRTIVGSAMMEGLAFFAAVAYLVEGGLLPLLLAILAVVGVALHFPSLTGTRMWIEDVQRAAREEADLR